MPIPTATLFGRTIQGPRVPVRYLVPPAGAVRLAVRVGLFETSTDVNDCAGETMATTTALDDDFDAFLVKRYGDDVFIGPTILAFVSTTKPPPATFEADRRTFNAWRGYLRAFREWKAGWDATSISVLSADAYRQCDGYRKDAANWRDKMVKMGVVPTAPKPTGTSSGLEDVVTLVKWVVVGTGAFGALLLLSRL